MPLQLHCKLLKACTTLMISENLSQCLTCCQTHGTYSTYNCWFSNMGGPSKSFLRLCMATISRLFKNEELFLSKKKKKITDKEWFLRILLKEKSWKIIHRMGSYLSKKIKMDILKCLKSFWKDTQSCERYLPLQQGQEGLILCTLHSELSA